jgi:hypothetical protein
MKGLELWRENSNLGLRHLWTSQRKDKIWRWMQSPANLSLPKIPVNREKYREISGFLVEDFEYMPSINNISGNLGRYSRRAGRNRTGNLIRVSGKLAAVNRKC